MFPSSPSSGLYNSPNSSSLNGISNNISMNESGAQCAPSFLFGQTNHGLKRRNCTSSSINPVSSAGILKATGPNFSPGGKSVHWSPLLVHEQNSRREVEKDSKNLVTSSLWNGPPLRSLMDQPPPEKQFCAGGDTAFRQRSSSAMSMSPGYSFTNQSMNGSSFAFSNNEGEEGSESAGNQREEDYWVTIFGFPPEQTSAILELFSKHGNIVTHKSPKLGNWVNVRYSTTIHTKQALSRNCKIFNNLMIGVVPCKDPDIIGDGAIDGVVSASDSVSTNGNLGTTSSAFVFSSGGGKNRNNTSATTGDKNDFFLNGSRLIPSVSSGSGNAFAPNDSLNTSRHSRLSISSRSGMRPLNRTDFMSENSLNNSSSQKPDDSLLGKFWSYIAPS